MTDCTPDADGRKCAACGWEWKYWETKPWPRRNCTSSITPEDKAARETAWKAEHDPHGKLARCWECAHFVSVGCDLATAAGVPCKKLQWLMAELAVPGECQRFAG